MARGENLSNALDFREYFSDDEHKVLLINDFLRYFAGKYPDDRTMRRRFYRTMESLADIMVEKGYWGRDPYPKD